MKFTNFKGVLLFALVVSYLIQYTGPIAYAQGKLVEFGVSPGDFTVKDAMLGENGLLQRLVIFNGDDIKRTFVLEVLVPENVTPGYAAIPNNSWIFPIPQIIEVDENSPGKDPYGVVEIYLNAPRQENLTSQKWEAWISVKRQAVIGETLESEIICRARIETSAELPPLENQITTLVISPTKFSLHAGRSIVLTATLTSDGNPVASKAITWNATSGSINPSSAVTNSIGQVNVTYTAPEKENSVTITASFAGDKQYRASSVSSEGLITAPSIAIQTALIISIVIGCAVIGVTVLLARKRVGGRRRQKLLNTTGRFTSLLSKM